MTNTLNRRGFLARLGLTAGVSATALAGVSIDASVEPIAEDPALLAIGEEIVPAVALVREAAERHRAAVEAFHADRPALPAALQDRSLSGNCLTENGGNIRAVDLRDGFGNIVWLGGLPVRYATADELRRKLSWYDKRTLEGRRFKNLLSMAERYEAEDAASLVRHRVPELSADWDNKQYALKRICDRMFEIEARTMVGIEIKAGAIGVVPHLDKLYRLTPAVWGPKLAENLLAVLAKEARA